MSQRRASGGRRTAHTARADSPNPPRAIIARMLTVVCGGEAAPARSEARERQMPPAVAKPSRKMMEGVDPEASEEPILNILTYVFHPPVEH